MEDLKNIIKHEDLKDYMALFPELVFDILDIPEIRNAKGDLAAWVARLLYRNVPITDVGIGLLTYETYKEFAPNWSEKARKECLILGWLMCMIVTAVNMEDDIFDNSKLRGFRKCWHLVDGVGIGALNDAQIILTCVQIIFDKHFYGDRKFSIFFAKHIANLRFNFGILNKIDYDASVKKDYSEETLKKLRNYASGFGSWIFAALGMYMAGISEECSLEERRTVHYDLDAYVLDNDDFADCFGGDDGNVVNEIGNDIEEGKCNWCIVTALQLVTEEDKRVLFENFGRKAESTPENREKVIQIFDKYDMRGRFKKHQDNRFAEIMARVDRLSEAQPKALFCQFYRVHFRNEKGVREDSEEEKQDFKIFNEMYQSLKNTQNFLSVLPEIAYNCYRGQHDEDDFRKLSPWLTRMFYYNVPRGKKTRGLTTVAVYLTLHGESVAMYDERMIKAYALGWCVEMLQASALMADDIMDSSTTRRGRPCWYKEKDLGIQALSDASILLTQVFVTLKNYLGDRSGAYKRITSIFQDVVFKTAIGQDMDIKMGATMDFDKFTMENYLTIVKYKTSYYTFYLPVVIAMALDDCTVKEMTPDTMQILLNIGDYFQVQDDYLDCFGDEEGIGKVGTDIADGKCSWLMVSALERATDEQRNQLKENYGFGLGSKEKLARVKKIYQELELPRVYHEYEEEMYQLLDLQIDQMNKVSQAQKDVIRKILEATYKRSS